MFKQALSLHRLSMFRVQGARGPPSPQGCRHQIRVTGRESRFSSRMEMRRIKAVFTMATLQLGRALNLRQRQPDYLGWRSRTAAQQRPLV